MPEHWAARSLEQEVEVSYCFIVRTKKEERFAQLSVTCASCPLNWNQMDLR